MKPKTTIKKTAARKPRVTAKNEAEEVIQIGLHNLKAPVGSHKKRKLLGRGSGSGHGKTSTRGSKGQTSRSGRDFYLGFEGGQTPLIRRIPKRGFINRFKKEYQIINLDNLNRIKEPNITLELLKEKGLIKDRNKLVKILGDGDINIPITIAAHAISKKAADKIKAAGGKIEIVSEDISYMAELTPRHFLKMHLKIKSKGKFCYQAQILKSTPSIKSGEGLNSCIQFTFTNVAVNCALI